MQQSLAIESLQLLQQQLAQPRPDVAQASMVLGTLQDRLFSNSAEPLQVLPDPGSMKVLRTDSAAALQAAVAQYMLRFQELLVAPAAAKLTKCKTPQDKVVAIAKVLRGKLAKAPAHKQPLHTQYLPSALKDSGKRQLDCLGIATAVLGMCHHIAAQQPEHADLATCNMVVSDDHCWLALPAQGTGTAAAASNMPATQQQQQQQQQSMVYVEVTDPGVLNASQLSGSWLYAGGQGTHCNPNQLLMVLVAGLMPEELQDETAAQQLREVQLMLLQQLAESHPEALFYSNFFRWGMLHEEIELQQLAAAAEAAAASGDLSGLQALALLPAQKLPSQQCYSTSMQRSSGWMWHPCSCAAFGWLNRMQAALCAETDNLLCLAAPQQQQQQGGQQQLGGHGVKPWLDIAVFLLQQALQAVAGCTDVLRKYSGCAGKPNKAADTQLMEAVRDLWENLTDASKAVAYLQQLQEHTVVHSLRPSQQHPPQQQEPPEQQEQPQVHQEQQQQGMSAALQHEQQCQQGEHTNAHPLHNSDPQQQQQQHSAETPTSPGGHQAPDMPAAAAVPSHTVHLAAAVNKAAVSSSQQHPVAPNITMKNVLSSSSWLQTQLEFLDALLCFFGEESADVPAGIVADFVAVAATYSRDARIQAVQDAISQQTVHSSRVQGLLSSSVWADLEAGLQQQLQMPGARSRKRQKKE